jgi:hypothetical protein
VVLAPTAVSAIWPTTGPIRGGSLVTVTGSGFINTPLLVCRFGTVVIAATWIGATSIECTSPAVASAATVALEMSNNNQDFTLDNSVFGYQADISVTSVSNGMGSQGLMLVF